jgi:hypothetical protein
MTAILDDVLADTRVTSARDLRERRAARARDAQARYRAFTKLFILATLFAAIAGALILYGAGVEATGAAPAASAETATAAAESVQSGAATRSGLLAKTLSRPWPRTLLFIVQVLSLAAAAYAAEMLRETRVHDDWLTERREAERGRVGLFDRIIEVAGERGMEAQKEAFEYFVTKQLDKQMKFHADADQRHRLSAGRSAVWGGLLAAGIAATGASGVGGPTWIAIAALVGVLAPILMNALRNWRESTLDREKADRYRATWDELSRLSADVGAARRALDKSDPQPALDLVRRVHDVMRAENEAWTPSTGKP